MSPSPCHPHPLRRCARARGGAPSSAWLRILVLLIVAMLATGAHPEVFAASSTATATAASGTAEHDVLDTALRPPTRQGHRPLTALRPDTGHTEREPDPRPVPAPAPTSYSPTLHALRCVVLRC
ncbi:hypothetical protein GCM10011579_039100 [Streptomyces albiflavescens]|uniref:Uncharacterized protein n=1 Tax=Streptomyces albiflavescens TaxID=1623582 RepID=A0A917Y624_9ACTN|nr:hypothetical protein [Streptomyces albiflavescens]GGN67031.1 hypothetical protein GCM10011579_039100 [Streptomyces albiflavescens]